MNWYFMTRQAEDMKQLVNRLIHGAWALPYFEKEDRYDFNQIRLMIDNDPHLMDLAWSLGQDDENAYERVMDAVRRELIRREEVGFKNKERSMPPDDPLAHVKLEIKGKSWEDTKWIILNMMPGGGNYGERFAVSDEQAEDCWKRAYGTIYGSGYTSLESLKESSPCIDFQTGARAVKRLSEIRNWELHGTKRTNDDLQNAVNDQKYEETQVCHSLFGFKRETPPEMIEVYRGVPRPGVQLRPGDYVTPNRSHARGYIRGGKGVIVRETVKTDDLVIAKFEVGDYNTPYFIYYPRDLKGQELTGWEDTPPPMTFRQFWQQVNS